MIRLTCTGCKRVLEIDDGFAGGVCRCQHCGTIQTVPARLKSSSRSAAPLAAVPAPKVLYKVPKPAVSADDPNLEDLAQAVASSGLTRSGLRAKTPAPPPAATRLSPRNKRLFLIVGGAAAGVILAIIILLLVHGSRAIPSNGEGIARSPIGTQ